jgi:hypothetical protein
VNRVSGLRLGQGQLVGAALERVPPALHAVRERDQELPAAARARLIALISGEDVAIPG